MLFVGFFSVPNLIVIIFNLLYPVLIMGFDCKGCVIEKVCENSSYWRSKRFSLVSRDLASRKVMHVPCTWLECEESVHMETVVSHEYLAGKAFPRDTRKTFYSAKIVLSDTQFLHPHYIYPHYPQMIRSASERKL